MRRIKNGTDSSQEERISRKKKEKESKSPGKNIRLSKKMRGELDRRSTGLEIIVMSIKRTPKETAAMIGMEKEEIEERRVLNREGGIEMSTALKGRERHLESGLDIYLGTDREDKIEEEIEDTERGLLAVRDIEGEI